MKKILSLLLVVAMMLSFSAVPAFAADFSDVSESYQYYDAVQSLVARGIINGYEDGTFRPEATITRGEFAKMIIYAIGLESMAADKVESSGFPDVAPEHWAASVIKIAYDMKIINGFEDGTFRADEKVTYDQAIKMTVCAKYDKFGDLAMKNGGYPTGYRKVANSYGFVKSITDGVFDAPAKRGTIAKLISNMLSIDLSKITDDPNASVETENQMTQLNGQIVAVYGASLESSVSQLTKYQIKVQHPNGPLVTYDASGLKEKDNLRSYLGKMITVYYYEDMGLDVQKLSSLTLQKNKNTELTIEMDNVIQPVTDTTLTYYDKDGDIEDLAIASGAKIIYNGSLVSAGTTFSSLVSANSSSTGNIRFLSTSGSKNSFDVVFFSVYKNYFVTSVNTNTKTVTLDNGSTVATKVIDEESRSKSVTIMKDGNSVAFSSIAKNQILSISEDLTGNFMEVLVGPAAVEGRVSAMTRDEGKITVGSKEYKFAPGVTLGSDIQVGSNLKIYLDAFGKIAKYEFKAAAVTYYYGYLTQVVNVGGVMESDVRAELIDLKSSTLKEFTVYSLADTVKINNQNYKTATQFTEIKAALVAAAQKYTFTASGKTYGAGAGEVYQPIKYTLSNNKIDSILVGKDNATDADLRVDASTLDTSTYASGIKCTTQHTVLAGGVYTLNSSTKVLYTSDSTNRSIAGYNLKSGNNSGFTVGSYYRVLLIDVNSIGVPSVVIVYNVNNVDVSATTNEWINNLPAVVMRKPQVEGYNNIVVQGYADSKEVTYHDEGTSFYNQVNLGDIVRIVADSAGVIEAMEIVARAADIYGGTNYINVSTRQAGASAIKFIDKVGSVARLISEGNNYNQDNAAMSLMAGTVYSLADNNLQVALDYATSSTTDWTLIGLGNEDHLKSMTVSSSTKVIAVNYNNGAIQSISTTAKASELIPYAGTNQSSVNTAADRVFVYRSGTTANLIVVYRAV